MKFLDEAKIYVKSGSGGDGCVAFRREKNIPFGGPNGGDGGRGGSIYIECVGGLNTLIDFRYQQHFKARKGDGGAGQQRTGASADDVIIKVPAGTQIIAEDKETLIADLTEPGQTLLLAKGGKGGLGNTHFKTSTNQAPRRFTKGEEGQELAIWLRLKLLSDAGLLGLPNAGKSTFLAATTRAKPKIADYPFTTLKPQLGVVEVDEREFVLADIPGLIEGAHLGVGLGLRFLGHIERCGILLHMIDGTGEDVAGAYRTVRHEIQAYDEALATKPEIIGLNKCDAMPDDEIAAKKAQLAELTDARIFTLSAATGEGVKPVMRAMLEAIDAYRSAEAAAVAAATPAPAAPHPLAQGDGHADAV